MKTNIEPIHYFPRWYDRKDVFAKRNEMKQVATLLIKEGRLRPEEVDEVNEIVNTFHLYKSGYSQNYQIRMFNELITCSNVRPEDYMANRKI